MTGRIRYEPHGPVASLTLDRPEKLNAIDAAMLDEITSALDRAEEDKDVRALLLKGEGRAFSAGFDLQMDEPPDGVSKAEHIRRELRRDFDLIMRVWDFPKPTIAAVHGYCLGSSLEISAVCDMTIAARSCRFGVPEVRFGSGIVCLILPWVIGLKPTNELLLLAENDISADRAAAIGLVNRVVPDEELAEAALAVANEVALNDTLAVRLTKKAIHRSLDIAGLRQALDEALEVDIDIETAETPESQAFDRILAEEGPKAAIAWRRSRIGRDES